jgi:hypothetical protein
VLAGAARRFVCIACSERFRFRSKCCQWRRLSCRASSSRCGRTRCGARIS